MEEYLTKLEPINWRDPTLEYPGPAGNLLASGLKRIHEDSASVFPESVYTSPSTESNRWRSLYNSDFIPIGWVDQRGLISTNGTADQSSHIPRDSGGVGGSGGERPRAARNRTSSAAESLQFMNWKVPSRLTDDGHRDLESRLSTGSKKHSAGGGRGGRNGGIPTPTAALNKTTLNASTALPQIETCSPPHSARPCRQEVTSPRKLSPRKPKAMAATELLSAHARGPILDESFPNPNLSQVEQALRLAAYEKAGSHNHEKSLYEWLQKASNKEREVAVKFFNNLAATLREDGTPEQKQKMQHIMAMLNREKGIGKPCLPSAGAALPNGLPLVNPHTSDDFESRLRYLRLLSPKTRRDRWMHQTWHHMPKHKDNNPVANTSAVYTQPGRHIGRHFTIHPDWGS